jgi:tRNA threonylcarbamoyladenosine modification (KEOPS) complex  Pcc1 subunit
MINIRRLTVRACDVDDRRRGLKSVLRLVELCVRGVEEKKGVKVGDM